MKDLCLFYIFSLLSMWYYTYKCDKQRSGISFWWLHDDIISSTILQNRFCNIHLFWNARSVSFRLQVKSLKKLTVDEVMHDFVFFGASQYVTNCVTLYKIECKFLKKLDICHRLQPKMQVYDESIPTCVSLLKLDM